jgi:DNA invertase Pin-like site-specific DNA recombinase
MKTARAILYLRVSTEAQATEGTSLATQEALCLDRAQRMGAEIVSVLRDEGVSGAALAGRPGILAALRLIETRRANVLIAANLSRFSRDAEHQQTLKNRIERAGGRLVLCDMELSDTPESDLQFGIMGQFADYERKTIRARTVRGRRHRAEEGIQPCRNISPYGYHVVTKEDVLMGAYPPGTVGTYIVIEHEAAVIRQVYSRYADGGTLRGLTAWLNANGVPTRSGVAWRHTSLRQILLNPVNKGLPIFGKTERCKDERRLQDGRRSFYQQATPADQWVSLSAPPIVSEEVWQTCAERMKANAVERAGRPGKKHLLTGVVFCPICGLRLGYTANKRGSYYSCPTKHEGKRKTYMATRFEPIVIDALLEVIARPELTERAVKAYTDRPRRGAESLPMLQRALVELSEREAAVVEAQVAGIQAGADPAIYAGMFKEIREKRRHLQTRMAAYQTEAEARSVSPKDVKGKIAQALADVEKILRSETRTSEEKNLLLRRVVKRIDPSDDGILMRLSPVKNRETVHLITITKTSVLRSSGIVTCQNSCSALAPSRRAAS